MMTRKKPLSIALAAILTVSAGAAYADGMTVAQLITSTTTLTGAISAATSSIVTNMQLLFRQATGRLAGEITKQTAAQAQIATDSQQKAWVQKKQEMEYNQSQKYLPPAPNDCDTATIGSVIGGAQSAAGASAIQMAQASGASDLVSKSQAGDAQSMVTQHLTSYCGPEDVQQQRGCGLSSLPNADITATSLLTGATNPANPKQSFTYTDQQMQAAKDYMNNSINPIKSPVIDPQLEKTPQGRAYIAMQYAEQAKLSLPQTVMSEILGMRQKVAGLGTMAKRIWSTIAPSYAANVGSDISYLEMLKLDVDRRYSNPDWYVQMAGASPEAVSREQAYMQALQIHLAFETFQQNERIEALLAQMVSDQAKRTMEPQLAAQRAAATKAGN